MSRRVQYLDELGGRGMHADSCDPEAERHPLPTYPYHWAPKGLMTRRQLRASGLRPGGQPPVAQILWKHRNPSGRTQQRVAFLYDTGKGKAETRSNTSPASRHRQGPGRAEDLPELPAGQGLLHPAVPRRVQRLRRPRRRHHPARRAGRAVAYTRAAAGTRMGAPGMTWHIHHGTGYLLCFDVPFGHARHYLGITVSLPQRLRDHEKGKGARLTGLARKAGISWILTRTWEDCDRNKERQLKNNPGTRYCPRCKKEKTMSEDPRYRDLMSQARADFAKSIAAASSERENAASKSAGTRQWNKAVQAAQNQLHTAREQAGQAWAETHPAQTRARALGRQTAGQHITAQADAGMPADRIGHVEQDISTHLLNEARTPDGRAFASEYNWAAETLVHELREIERQPGPELEAAG